MPFLLSISSAFAHTRCISPSVTAFSSFIRRATSLLRGRRGRSRAVRRISLREHKEPRLALRGRSRAVHISLGEHKEPRLARRGRSRAVRRISLREHKEPRLVRIFAPCGYFHENLYKKQPAAFRKSTKRKQRAVRSWIFGENARHGSAKDAGFSPTYG